MSARPHPPLLGHFRRAVGGAATVHPTGSVTRVVGNTIEAAGLTVRLGSICWVDLEGEIPVSAEVVGFRDQRITLVPFGDIAGVQPGSPVRLREQQFRVPVGKGVLGRVLDGFGRPIDDKGPLHADVRVMTPATPDPLARARITRTMSTGVRAIDGLLTTGMGQRMGIFAGSGVGKSTLLGMIARHSSTDTNVIALIGERGREVQEFIDEQLGAEGLARSVVVVATSDQPALLRLKAAEVAMTIAESFRDNGGHVTLLMDSVTRLAMAQREIGLSAGEPPALRGYPPSVFSYLPRLLERAGSGDEGTITGFFTVLVEGDDFNEPVADTVRSILDGHIVLTRTLAERNHYPAIDVLASVSRVMPTITTNHHRRLAGSLRTALAEYEGAKDLIEVGAYAPGSSAAIDRAIRLKPDIDEFLRQDADESGDVEGTVGAMGVLGLLDGSQEQVGGPAAAGPGSGAAAGPGDGGPGSGGSRSMPVALAAGARSRRAG
jgi:FliI/YscN family ATPase